MDRKLIFYNGGKQSQIITIPDDISANISISYSKGYVMLVKPIDDISKKNNELYGIFNNINLIFVSKIEYVVDGKVVVDVVPLYKFDKEYIISDDLYFGRLSDKNSMIYEIINIYQNNGGTNRWFVL